MTAELIPFPQREPSTFDDGWALVPTTMKRRSCKLATLRDLWGRHGATFGQRALLESLRAYITDKDFDRHGGQALERWLRAGRYENFTPAAPPPKRDQFPDTKVRDAIVAQLGESFAILYLDPCTQDGTTLIARTDMAIKRMMEHRAVFKALGFTGMRRRSPAK